MISFIENLRYIEATGCWEWTGRRANGRYGEITYNGEDQLVHRVSAHIYLGYDLESPLRVLHHCDNPPCFNPKHLYIGTQAQNMADAVARRRLPAHHQTECHQGHTFNEENTYFDSKGRRNCRQCHAEAQRRYSCKA